MKKLRQQFCDEVRRLMNREGVNQACLAARLGVSRPVVSRMLAGENVTLARIEAVALALGAEARFEFLQDEGEDI